MPLNYKVQKPRSALRRKSKSPSRNERKSRIAVEAEPEGTTSAQTGIEIEQCRFLKELPNAENCSKEEAMRYLREFDLEPNFGPCMDITRSQRHQMALKYGPKPPASVGILLRRFIEEDPQIDNCLWSQYII